MPRQPTTHQSDLFFNSAPQTVQIPPWQALPEETRRLLTRLMVRLILDRVDGDQSVQREGSDHDA
ncbi:hypothetical protein [Pseudorhodoplanes sp.]|uniref:hypothetical protein n=1 Tax=Pseudorhodoplanes sp. TaxID=1934341 RepID=UPI003D14095A